jgi:phenylacetate-coenzyme A ligase PaaK-like adenylate-forming protein
MNRDELFLRELFERPQYSLRSDEKSNLLLPLLRSLTEHHATNCSPYRKILEFLAKEDWDSIEKIPYVPVALFKSHNLLSVPEREVVRTMTSSGTTGQQLSRIHLDKATAELQSRALSTILKAVLGTDRRPMLIVDSQSVIKNRTQYSARTAGILGIYPFGRHHLFALDDDMELRYDAVASFLAEHSKAPIVVFGFTFMVWKYLHGSLTKNMRTLDMQKATLIHSGGWKALLNESVDNASFKAGLAQSCGINAIHNYYGMVEQTGSIFLEGGDGYLYPSNFSDVIIRDPRTLEPVGDGEPGVVQVLSVLPQSYPGHSILTEDVGVIDGVSNGDEWRGKRLRIIGRLPKSEVRGCSDTHANSI